MPSTEVFWSNMGAYNQATLPVQLAMMIMGAALAYYVYTRGGFRANALMNAFFSFSFCWTGLVFFIIYSEDISRVFSLLFFAVGLLFALDIHEKKNRFTFPVSGWERYATFSWIILVILYPLVGTVLGHRYPGTCMPMAPCPLTVLAIALVSAAIPSINRKVLVALLPWGILGLPKCLGALDCYEDCILFAAGVYGLILIVKNWRAIGEGRG
jgi:hypothetical protein